MGGEIYKFTNQVMDWIDERYWPNDHWATIVTPVRSMADYLRIICIFIIILCYDNNLLYTRIR